MDLATEVSLPDLQSLAHVGTLLLVEDTAQHRCKFGDRVGLP